MAVPPWPRLATPGGCSLLSVGAGLQPFATIATYFKKLMKTIKGRKVFQFWVAMVASLALPRMGTSAVFKS